MPQDREILQNGMKGAQDAVVKDGKAEGKQPLLGSAPSRKPRTTLQYLAESAFDAAEWALDLATRDGTENYWLSGNHAPVLESEGVVRGLKISGELPSYVRGEFFRVTPNPKYKPRAGYHWFDGDGMLHGVRFSNGEASYVNRYVKTARLAHEDEQGRAFFIKIGDMKGVAGLARIMLMQARAGMGLVNLSSGVGTANTAVLFHGGAVLALNEGDMPYAVRVLQDGELETVGRVTYGGSLDHSLTAHPKLDPATGELFTYGYSVNKAPYVQFRVVTPSGSLGPKVPITIPEPVMMHDFALTERHAIFMDLPVVFDPKAMVKTGTVPFTWREGRAARFGVLPRNDTSEANIRWFSLPPLFIFHTGNAWEDAEQDEVVLIACRFDRLNMNKLEANTETPGKLTEFRFNLRTGHASERTLADTRCDFPRVNDGFLGRKTRFMYASVVDGVADIVGVVKFDLSREPALLPAKYPSSAQTAAAECQAGGCVASFFDLGAGRFGSEAVFVPRSGAPLLAPEDDGCLLNMVFDSRTNLSEVLVIDAKTMSATPIAVVYLTTRVPFGFHGTFVTEEQLEKQK